jgi:Protein of unknown function (DUF1552)
MSTAHKGPTRRHFLRGVGGFLLAIPFLDSMALDAKAGANGVRKRFVAFLGNHGGALPADMQPKQAILKESITLPFQSVRRGALADALTVSAGTASLSPILSASTSALTGTIVQKMNVLRGLVLPFYPGHQRAGHLGNWAAGDSDNSNPQLPTIDQVMGNSPSFYESTPRVRVMVTPDNVGSWGYENPAARSGNVVRVAAEASSLAMFAKVYTAPDPNHPKRGPVVDRVLADYNRVRASARISSADRVRLDAHIAHVAELEKKLGASQSCGAVATPTADSKDLFGSDLTKAYQLLLDVVALAFACDTSRIATIPVSPNFFGCPFSHYTTGDYHGDIAHQVANLTQTTPTGALTARQWQNNGYQRVFEDVFLYLTNKLDAMQEGAGTVLDTSLLAWTHESGIYTHDGYDFPVVTAGSAVGAIRTGSHVDYRDMARKSSSNADKTDAEQYYYGLTWHQYLGTILQAMGIPASDYDPGNSYGGYGLVRDADSWYGTTASFVPALGAANDMLPFLKP